MYTKAKNFQYISEVYHSNYQNRVCSSQIDKVENWRRLSMKIFKSISSNSLTISPISEEKMARNVKGINSEPTVRLSIEIDVLLLSH